MGIGPALSHCQSAKTTLTNLTKATSRFNLHSDGSITYTVQTGDTLSIIARGAFQFKYGRCPDSRELMNAVLCIDLTNQLHGQLRIGQVLEWKAGLNSPER